MIGIRISEPLRVGLLHFRRKLPEKSDEGCRCNRERAIPAIGKAEFAVIKLTGDLADNAKYTHVPFSLLKFSDTQKKDIFGHRDLILQTDRDKLMSASRFTTKTWPEHVTWGQDVYAYYGVPWDSSFGQGGTGASINSSTGTGMSTVTVVQSSPTPSTRT